MKALKFVYGYLDEDRASRELKALNRIWAVRHPFLLSLYGLRWWTANCDRDGAGRREPQGPLRRVQTARRNWHSPRRAAGVHPRCGRRARLHERAPGCSSPRATRARRSNCSTKRWTSARAADRGGSLIEAGLLRALAHHANGDTGSATADLAAALTSGVPAGYCRLFLDEGQPMVELLGHAARAAAHDVRTHAEHLLAAAHRPSAPAPAGPVEEGLSERELEVLRLLATELSGPEIAATALCLGEHAAHAHQAHLHQARREHPPRRGTSSCGPRPALSGPMTESPPQSHQMVMRPHHVDP